MVTAITGVQGGVPDTSAMWQALLQRADTDGDGKISKAEFTAMAPTDGKGPNPDDLFAKIDTNKDGAIDEEEMQAAAQKMHHKRPHHAPNLDALFKAADTDGDGKISKDEFKAIFEPSDANTGLNSGQVFNQMDTDGDGKVSAAEFMAAMQKATQSLQSTLQQSFSTLA
jgi:Ca2+-binding EF-hand superfamily protein